MNSNEEIKFGDGTKLETGTETMYLANELNTTANIKTEITHKKQEVRKTWFKLKPYWKAKDTNQKWQIIIFDAIIRSKLLYGLETVQLTNSMEKELNAFQMRGLRQILKNTHTYWNREHTNKHILEEATTIAYPKGDKQILLYSATLEEHGSLP